MLSFRSPSDRTAFGLNGPRGGRFREGKCELCRTCRTTILVYDFSASASVMGEEVIYGSTSGPVRRGSSLCYKEACSVGSMQPSVRGGNATLCIPQFRIFFMAPPL